MSDIGVLITESLLRNKEAYGDLPAVIGDTKRLSHRELYESVDRVGLALSNIHIDRSITVGLRFKDPIRHLVISLSLLKMGITQVSINTKESLKAQQQTMMQTGIELVIHDLSDDIPFAPSLAMLDPDLTLHLVRQSSNNEQGSKGEILMESGNPALIFMGSGTTGKPKIIAVNFSTFAHLIDRDINVRDFQPGERHYALSALDYYTAKRRVIGCLVKGVTLLLPEKKPDREVEFCREFEVDHLSLTTTQVIMILDQEKDYLSEPYPRLPQLRSLFVGSSPVIESIRNEIRNKLSRQLYVVYGTNEFGEATIASPEDHEQYPGTVGHPCPDVTLEVIGEDGKICSSGVKGRIRLRSENMMDAYQSNGEASRKAFTEEGYYPGDLGYLTKEGHLMFSGREDDMMIFQGVNIYPREIEQILESHPYVVESAAFPLTINNHEGVPFAAVKVDSEVSEKELLNLCKKKLGFLSPKQILFVKEFPRNAAGKVLKRELIKIAEPKLAFQYSDIPKIIHQSYYSRSLPKSLGNNIEKLKSINPNWEYRFYDDDDQIKFMKKHYGPDILKAYNKINPLYGAARADFFRYLLIYKVGGVWLDIKSSINQNLDISLKTDDLFLLSQWQNKMGESSQGWGLHSDLIDIPGGEFQQWHIISAPGNPLIKAVILKVLQNIHTYTPEKFGIGCRGIWRTTGPIAYTLAIAPLLRSQKHRFVDIRRDFKFQYNIFERHGHEKLFKTHCSTLKEPVILA